MAPLFSKFARLAGWIALAFQLALSLAHAGPSRPPPTEFAVEGRNVVLKGVRYANPGRPPIILFHGLVENSRIWRELGYRLHELGYDVWMPNFRGHGKGTHRSTVKNYTKGMYGFEHMVTEDVPLMVEHVQAEAGLAPHLGGHSMGGMAIKEYAAGVYRLPSGALARSDELARTRAGTKMGKLISIGSPPHMKDLPSQWGLAGRVSKPITSQLRTTVPLVGLERAPTELDAGGVLAWARGKAFSLVDPMLPYLIPKGVLDASNLTREEMIALREKSLSSLHTDILDDFAYWTKTRKFSARDGFSYETDRKIYAPSLYVAGDSDSLAGVDAMREEARMLPAEASPRVAVISGTGHVDLIAGERAADRLGPLIGKWIESPERLDGVEFMPRAGKCSIRQGLAGILRSKFK